MNQNQKAFLDMIAVSEGTSKLGDNGYNVIVGGALFNDYSKHPNAKVFIKSINNYSTAAGRYQLLYKYWIAYCIRLKLNDFSPITQDIIALQQIKECKAIDDINNGNFEEAIKKCSRIWASLPGAGYGQHENKLDKLKIAYIDAGGVIA